MKKRVLALILAVFVAGGLFTGCKKNSSTSKDVTTITVWTGDAGAQQTLLEIVENFNNNIGKEKKINIELTVGGSDYSKSIDIAHQNDQLPDIFGATGDQRRLFAKNGDIVALNKIDEGKKLIEESGLVATPSIEDGNVYSLANSTLTSGIVYNKDLFKKYGIKEFPKTWSELRDVAKKLTNEKEQIYGYAFPFKESLVYTLQTPYFTSGGEGKTNWDELTVDYSELSTIFELMLKMKDDGSLFPGADTLDNDTARAYFAEGRIAMMPAVSWDVSVYTTQFVAKCDWAVAPGPVNEKAKKVYPSWSAPSGGYLLSQKSYDEKKEAVMEVYNYLHSDEALSILAEGTGKILVKTEIMNNLKNADKHTVEFANLYDPDMDMTEYPRYSVEGENFDDTMRKVWAGDITLKEAVKYLNKNATDGLRKAAKEGTIDVTPYQSKK